MGVTTDRLVLEADLTPTVRAEEALRRLYAARDTLVDNRRCTLSLLETMTDALHQVTTAVGLLRVVLMRRELNDVSLPQIADWLLSDPEIREYVKARFLAEES
jgi:hypothetical protein